MQNRFQYSVGGGLWHPQILEDQLTLSQPGGDRLSPASTPEFSDLPTALQYTVNTKHNGTEVFLNFSHISITML